MRTTFPKLIYTLPAMALMAGAALGGHSSAARAADAGLSETQKAEVRQVIKEYMRDNPEIVVESFKAFQEKQQMEQLAAVQGKITDNMKLLTASDLPSAGNPKGDVTVIEFFDYNCGYCKKAIEDIKHVIESDKNVRFVFFDMPILGPSSVTAAQWAHAAHKQGKYFEFHTALMEHSGQIDENVLADLAKKAGLDVEKLRKDAASEETVNSVQNSLKMGHDIGIQGTPGFIVGTELFPGYLGQDGLTKAIAAARAGKKN